MGGRDDAFQKITWTRAQQQCPAHSIPSKYDGLLGALAAMGHTEVFVLRYCYGEMIVEDGTFRLPEGVNDEDQSLFKRQATYAPLPLCLVTQHCAEVFTAKGKTRRGTSYQYTYPRRIRYPGEFFGLFEVASYLRSPTTALPRSPYSVSAGARTIRILARLKGQAFMRALASELAVSNIGEHSAVWENDEWRLAKLVAGHIAKDDWFTEVVVFPKELFTKSATPQLKLKLEVALQAWDDSRYIRTLADQNEARIEWEGSLPNQRRGYFRDLFQYLIAVAEGIAPAFRPVNAGNCDAGPLCRVQEVLCRAVRSATRAKSQPKQRAFPAILEPVHIRASGEKAFYSLRLPTLPILDLEDREGREISWRTEVAMPLSASLSILQGYFRRHPEIPLDFDNEALFALPKSAKKSRRSSASGHDRLAFQRALTDGIFIPLDDKAGMTLAKDHNNVFFVTAIEVKRK